MHEALKLHSSSEWSNTIPVLQMTTLRLNEGKSLAQMWRILQKRPQLSIHRCACHIAITRRRGSAALPTKRGICSPTRWPCGQLEPEESRGGMTGQFQARASRGQPCFCSFFWNPDMTTCTRPGWSLQNERLGRPESRCSSCGPATWQSPAKISKATSPNAAEPRHRSETGRGQNNHPLTIDS